MQGEEINKVSSQSPWPAVDVFLGWGLGGARRWAVFVIHKLC